jgi:HAD superfamily hydrolase (TIGR01509 family)
MMGMRTDDWARYMHDDLRVSLPPSEIVERVVAKVIDHYDRRVPIMPGAGEALARLAPDFGLGLATSAALPAAQAVLAKTGWNKYFQVVVSADTVARGKPAPDVYLRAIELLNADPAATAAIEDSASGIQSANSAGLLVVAIPNREFPPDEGALSLAAVTIESLEELTPQVIRGLFERRR